MSILIDTTVLDAALADLEASLAKLRAAKAPRETQSRHQMHTYTPEWATIVFYDVQPYEKPTQTYPGCDLECTPTKVLFDGHDITYLYEGNADRWGTLCDECLEHYTTNVEAENENYFKL